MGVGLAVEELGDEAFLVVGGQVGTPPRVEAFVADRGGGDGAQGLAAGAAGAVAGVDLDVVGQGQELIPQAREELPGAGEAGVDAAGGLVQQVRAAEVAGEDEVTGEQVAGGVGERAVGDQEGQVLGGVARGVQGLDGDVAQGDLVVVVQASGLEAVLPVGAALAGDVGGGAGRGGQFTGAGEEVGVDVGLGDGDDLHPVGGRERPVDLDVAAGVDDERLALGLAADEVAGLGEVFVVNALDEHVALLQERGSVGDPEESSPSSHDQNNTPGGICTNRRGLPPLFPRRTPQGFPKPGRASFGVGGLGLGQLRERASDGNDRR